MSRNFTDSSPPLARACGGNLPLKKSKRTVCEQTPTRGVRTSISNPAPLYSTMRAPIYLNSRETSLHRSGEYLLIEKSGHKTPCPSESVSYVVKIGDAYITNSVVNFLSEKKIPIFSYSYGGKWRWVIIPQGNNIGKSRLMQYKAYFDNEKRLAIAKNIIKKAVEKKIIVLKKYKQKEAVKKIRQINIDKAQTIESLRGIEGGIANIYFSALKDCFKYFKWDGREYNPPKGEINCILSWSFSMLYAEIFNHVHAHGLDVFLGYLHEPNDMQTPLVYDVSEIFKDEVVGLVISLINKNQFKDFHFNKKPDGNCLLSTQGKAFFLKEWIAFLRKTKSGETRSSFTEEIAKEVIGLKDFVEGDCRDAG